MITDLPDFLSRNIDGEICLTGHRIRLIDVAARYEEGHSAESIVLDHYPTLNLSLVYKTISFYLEHEGDVRELMKENAEAMQSLEQQLPRGPSVDELRRRLEARRRAEAS